MAIVVAIAIVIGIVIVIVLVTEIRNKNPAMVRARVTDTPAADSRGNGEALACGT